MPGVFLRHLTPAILFGVTCSAAIGQPQRYSTTLEYQRMIEEIHAAAPSPLFIATGQRPIADLHLAVRVHEDRRSLQLATKSAIFTFDKTLFTLTAINPLTKDKWVISLPNGDSGCAPGPSPAPEIGSASPHTPASSRPMKTLRRNNLWVLSAACASECTTLELLSEGLSRITYARAGSDEGNVQTRGFGLHIEGTAPFFGLGERFWQAGLANTNLDVRPEDKSGEPGHNWVYVAIPFVYDPGGLGLYADTAFDSQFHFNAAGSAFDVRIANNPVSLYLFSAPDPKAVLGEYTALTGRAPNVPLWTFGPWITAVQGKDAVLEMAQTIRARGIPASALWIYDELDEANNLGWPFWFSSYYGDARTFTDTLHAQGFKVLSYVHSYVREKMIPYPGPAPAYTKGVAEKLLVTGADGLPTGPGFEPVRTGYLDFTNPAAVDWWQAMITSAVRDQGFDGWMEDFGEWINDTDSFAAGKGSLLSELYPLLYHKITYRIGNALNPNLVPFSRSGSPGSQQFSPMLWGADQQHNWSRDYGLPSVVTAGITAGMSGFSTWGPDILSDGPDKELWIRWAEFGALTPVMRDHPWAKPPNSVSIWYDAETTALFRKYAILHSTLLPYFAACAEEAHRTGVPIIRHTMLEYPDDPRSYTAEYQYLLGKDLLVAPVIEPGATTRKLYLPRGEWVNYWTGEHYPGGKDVTVAAPLDQIPIMVRAGSILPFKPEAETASFNWSDPQLLAGSLIWKVYPETQVDNIRDGDQSSFTLPDGASAHMRSSGGAMVVEGNASMIHSYEIVVHASAGPESVRLDGMPLHNLTGDKLTRDDAWWFNSASHELHVVLQTASFHLDIAGLR